MVIKSDVCVEYNKTTGDPSYYRNDKLLNESEMNAIRSSGDIYFFPSCNRFMSAIQVNSNVTKILIKEKQLEELMKMMKSLLEEYDSPVKDKAITQINEITLDMDQLYKGADLKTMEDKIKNDINELSLEINDIRANHSLKRQVSDLKSQLDTINNDLIVSTNQLRSAESLLKTKQDELDNLLSASNANQGLQDANDLLSDNNKELVKKIADLNTDVSKLKKEIADLTSLSESQTSQITDQKQQIDDLTKEKNRFRE